MLRRTKFRLVPGLFTACLLTGGTLSSLSAQTVATWNGGTGNWSTGSLWSTGGAPNGGNYDVFIDGGKTGVNSVVSMDGNYTVGRLTLDAGDTLNINDGVQLFLNNGAFTGSGSLVNNGTLTLNATTNGVYMHLGGPVTLAGNGTLNLVGPNVRVYADHAGDRLTIGAGQTVQGQGNLGVSSTTFTNNGTVNANVNGGTLTIQPGGGAGDFTNNHELEATVGGTLLLSNSSGGKFTNTANGVLEAYQGGTLNVAAGALTNFSGTTLTGGIYRVSVNGAGTSTLSPGGGSIVTNNAVVSLFGAGAVFNEINALADNQGTFQVFYHNFTTVGALNNSGSVISESSTLTVAGNLTNSGTAASYYTGTFAVQGNLVNSGQLVTGSAAGQPGMFSPGAFTVTGTLTQTAAGTLFGGGRITAPSMVLGGSVRPGDINDAGLGYIAAAVGTLTLNGNVGLLGNAVLVFDLASTAASDNIKVNGALTLAGTLTVNALSGFGAGRYDLIDYTGTLTNNGLALGTLPAGYNYAIDTSIAGQVDLVVTNAVPEPSTWAAMLAGGGFLARAVRRRASRL